MVSKPYLRLLVAPLALLLAAGASRAAPPGETSPSAGAALYLSPGRQFSRVVRSWHGAKREFLVGQSQEYTCGAASLATILRYYHGRAIGERQVLEAALTDLTDDQLRDRQENGLSMEDLASAAKELGFAAATLEMQYDKLRELPVPVVVRLVQEDFKHFVVYRGESGPRVFLGDPLRGNVRTSVQRFQREWDNKVLAVVVRGEKPRPHHPLQAPSAWPTTPEAQAARRFMLQQARRPPARPR